MDPLTRSRNVLETKHHLIGEKQIYPPLCLSQESLPLLNGGLFRVCALMCRSCMYLRAISEQETLSTEGSTGIGFTVIYALGVIIACVLLLCMLFKTLMYAFFYSY